MGNEVVSELVEPPSTSGYQQRGRSRTKWKDLLTGFNEHRWEMVMAYKTDRLSRGGGPGWAPLVEAIEQAGLSVDQAVATPSGFVSEFELGIRAAMDREESKKMSERLTDVNARKASQGLAHTSVAPFGYTLGYKELVPEQVQILRLMSDRILGGESIAEVVGWLNRTGELTQNGSLWSSRSVKRLLTRKAYAGIREYRGIDYAAAWTPVFDAATWTHLQAALDARSHPTSSASGPSRV